MDDSDVTSGVFAREFDRLDRAVQLGFASGQLIKVEYPSRVSADADSTHDVLDRVADYLAGEEDNFDDVPLAITVPTDQRRVLEAVRQVPYGENASVSQVARMANLDPNEPDDVALAKEALRGNPAPLVIPDHRVQGGPYSTPGDVRTTFRSVEGI